MKNWNECQPSAYTIEESTEGDELVYRHYETSTGWIEAIQSWFMGLWIAIALLFLVLVIAPPVWIFRKLTQGKVLVHEQRKKLIHEQVYGGKAAGSEMPVVRP